MNRSAPIRPLITVVAAVLLSLALPERVLAQYELSPPDVAAGHTASVTLPPGADTLIVTYRPNSLIATRDTFVATGGQVDWTPTQAGIVSLSSPRQTARTVSIRFDEPPVSGIMVLVLAGTILFGGAIFATYHLFSDPGPRPDPAVRPDT